MEARPSIIVPVHDEAHLLPRTLPPLLREAATINADLVLVCNGCTDESANLARSFVGENGRVVELPIPNKSLAIRDGETLVSGFPRFIIDADVVLGAGCLSRLCATLCAGHADLVAPSLRIDISRGSPCAAAVSSIWRSLPHMSRDGFHNVLGISRCGRRAWGEMPDLMADDAFIMSRIPSGRRMIVRDATATIFPPRTLASWIGVRRRWAAGHAQLQERGSSVPCSPHQGSALLRMLVSRHAFGAVLYAGVVIAARLPVRRPREWFRDRTTRTPAWTSSRTCR